MTHFLDPSEITVSSSLAAKGKFKFDSDCVNALGHRARALLQSSAATLISSGGLNFLFPHSWSHFEVFLSNPLSQDTWTRSYENIFGIDLPYAGILGL